MPECALYDDVVLEAHDADQRLCQRELPVSAHVKLVHQHIHGVSIQLAEVADGLQPRQQVAELVPRDATVAVHVRLHDGNGITTRVLRG